MVLRLSRPDSDSVSLLGVSPHEATRHGLVRALRCRSLIRNVTVRELLSMASVVGDWVMPNPMPNTNLRGDDAVGAATVKDKKTITPARPGGLTFGCRE